MKRVFVDMDGVLCEYRAGDSVEDMAREGYFRGLAPRRKTVEAVKRLIEKGDAAVYVLSAVFPHTAEASVREKNEWLDEFLPEIDGDHRIFTLCGTN